MKKSIIAPLFFIILIAPSFAQAWHTEAHYDAIECAICGKTIYVYREASYGPYMPSSGTLFSAHSCPGERAYKFSMITRHVCEECLIKYSEEFAYGIETFIMDRRLENIKLIETHQEEQRQKGIEDRKKKIIELEKELEGLRK